MVNCLQLYKYLNNNEKVILFFLFFFFLFEVLSSILFGKLVPIFINYMGNILIYFMD